MTGSRLVNVGVLGIGQLTVIILFQQHLRRALAKLGGVLQRQVAMLASKEGKVVLLHDDGQDATARLWVDETHPDGKGDGVGLVADTDMQTGDFAVDGF